MELDAYDLRQQIWTFESISADVQKAIHKATLRGDVELLSSYAMQLDNLLCVAYRVQAYVQKLEANQPKKKK